MLNPQSLQLRVDVGSRCHHVAVGLTDGSLLEDFEIPHTAEGFREFFARIEGHAKRHPYLLHMVEDLAHEVVTGKVDPDRKVRTGTLKMELAAKLGTTIEELDGDEGGNINAD